MLKDGWVDVEELRARIEGRPANKTCFPEADSGGTRIDIIWANPLAAQVLIKTETLELQYGPTHKPISAEFDWRPLVNHVYNCSKPLPMTIPKRADGKRWDIEGMMDELARGNLEGEEAVKAEATRSLLHEVTA
jgi:hypothetical protein